MGGLRLAGRGAGLDYRAHMLAAVCTALLWGMSVVFATRSARLLGGPEANFWRLIVATALLAVWSHVWGQGLTGASVRWFLASGVIGVGADVFLFEALTRVGPRLSSLIIQCFSAVAASLVEWVWLGTRLTGPQMAACAVILVGVVIALAPREHLHIPRPVILSGVTFGLLAALGNGWGAVISRKGFAVARAAGQPADPGTAAYQRLLGGLAVAAVFWAIVRWRSAKPVAPLRERLARSWPWVLANAVAGQTLGVTCYQWALKTTPTGLVLAIVATTPLAVIPFAARIENEKAGIRSLIGGEVAVAGAILLILVR